MPLILFGFTLISHADEPSRVCESQVERMSISEDFTVKWIQAMAFLEERTHVLPLEQYRSWLTVLTKGQVINPFEVEAQGLGSEASVWSRVLSLLLNSNHLNIQRIAEYAQQRLLAREFEVQGRTEVTEGSQSILTRARFLDTGFDVSDVLLSLPPGVDEAAGWGKRKIQLMETPFTQWMWVTLMENNPSHFSGDNEVSIHGRVVRLGFNLPVENVSIQDLQDLLTFLNDPDAPLEQIQNVISDHRSGDLYTVPNGDLNAELFERDFLSYVGTILDQATGGQSLEFEAYAWLNSNSMKKTQAVGLLKPLKINGRSVYDWFGNVSEWQIESWESSYTDRYQGQHTGGSFLTDITTFENGEWARVGLAGINDGPAKTRLEDAWMNVGFRLVRVRTSNGNEKR